MDEELILHIWTAVYLIVGLLILWLSIVVSREERKTSKFEADETLVLGQVIAITWPIILVLIICGLMACSVAEVFKYLCNKEINFGSKKDETDNTSKV